MYFWSFVGTQHPIHSSSERKDQPIDPSATIYEPTRPTNICQWSKRNSSSRANWNKLEIKSISNRIELNWTRSRTWVPLGSQLRLAMIRWSRSPESLHNKKESHATRHINIPIKYYDITWTRFSDRPIWRTVSSKDTGRRPVMFPHARVTRPHESH